MNYKTLAAILYDFFVTGLSFYLAFALRFSSFTPKIVLQENFWPLFIIIVLAQMTVFYTMGLYKGVWKYASTSDLIKIIKASCLAVSSSFIIAFLYMRLEKIPRSIYVIDLILLIISLGGGRFFYRILKERFKYSDDKKNTAPKAVIVGAGVGGEQLFREIQKNNFFNISVIGFVDDDITLKKRTIHGKTVIGTTNDLSAIIIQQKIEQIYIAIPSATGQEIKRIYDIIKPYHLEIKILPKMSDILNGKIEFSKLRHIKIEDLLGREEVKLNLEILKDMLENKTIMVTGAGGSIGSELCRQLAHFNPKKLIALDVSEAHIYELDQNLRQNFPELNFHVIVSDVREPTHLKNIFNEFRPEVVLHAAAYKHVPLMEFNPFESIRTNILGTYQVAKMASESKVERFVFISTDKAVNPTNIMGTTKRIAEMIIQDIQKCSPTTKFMTVRFGNVLGSSGSVIPLFQKQIENGGPLTVTSDKITRYFMSIPEATKLVLQAGAMGNGGELFVLDMGGPIRIIDLAKEMITLAGLKVDVDIKIEVTKLRPGEKLYEEPLMNLETSLPTGHPKVKISCAREISPLFKEQLDDLLNLSPESPRENFIALMNKIVPEYTPYATTVSVESPVESQNSKQFH